MILIFGVWCFSFCGFFFFFAVANLQYGILFAFCFCFFIMATKRDDSLQFVSVKLDGKNYLYWSYVMRNFLKEKKIVGICC